MKHLLWVLVWSAVPHSISVALGEPSERSAPRDAADPVVVTGEGVVWVDEDGRVSVSDGHGAYVVTVTTDAGTEDGRSEVAAGASTVKVRRVGEGKNRAWLGVSIDGVPGAMADQLNTGEKGVLVVNVAKDSPADRAGLEAHDVILSIDGDVVAGGASDAVKLISSRTPGDEVDIVVLRDGTEHTFNVALGSVEEADIGAVQWKFEVTPEARIEDEVKTRGRMMFRGPTGEWISRELGELDELKDLPESIKLFMPKSGHRVMTYSGEGGEKQVQIKVQRDGVTIVVEQKGDGDIKATRVDENGNETTESYATAEDLEAADEEAYRMYKQSGTGTAFAFSMDGIGELPEFEFDKSFNFEFDMDDDEWNQSMDEWRTTLDDSFSEAHEAYEKAMEQFHETMKKLHEEKGLPPVHLFRETAPFGHAAPQVFMGHVGKPRHTFEVRTDGTIEVRIRKGDAELIELYDGEDDLARRARDLYEKYEDLMSVKPE
jgi:hypothetical protein